MQNKETASRVTRADDYVTIVQQACNKVNEFDKLHADLERQMLAAKAKVRLPIMGVI